MQPNPNRTADFSAVPCGALGFAIFLGLLAAAVLALPAPAQAQDGAEVWGRAGCSTCHGILAEGGDDPAEPTGPSLRITRLDRDLIAEAIAGGRPGTAMPFNLNGAYTEIACYGIPLGEVPAETAGAGGLTAEDLEALMTLPNGQRRRAAADHPRELRPLLWRERERSRLPRLFDV